MEKVSAMRQVQALEPVAIGLRRSTAGNDSRAIPPILDPLVPRRTAERVAPTKHAVADDDLPTSGPELQPDGQAPTGPADEVLVVKEEHRLTGTVARVREDHAESGDSRSVRRPDRARWAGELEVTLSKVLLANECAMGIALGLASRGFGREGVSDSSPKDDDQHERCEDPCEVQVSANGAQGSS